MNEEIIHNLISNIDTLIQNNDIDQETNECDEGNEGNECDEGNECNECNECDKDLDNKCCICLEEMNDLHDTILLSCNHILHKKCLFSYVATNYKNEEVFNTCPLCRKYISTNVQSNINIVHVKNMTTSNKLLLILSVFTNLSFLSVHIFNLFR
tara:strand:- start:565 stop:1026 length:462 start_codon:yes stop_codon:yes gene_type:complete